MSFYLPNYVQILKSIAPYQLVFFLIFFFIDFQEQFIYILACATDEDEARVYIKQEYDNFENPFQAWANSIKCESKSLIEIENGINLF